jgi:hypothetical protein
MNKSTRVKQLGAFLVAGLICALILIFSIAILISWILSIFVLPWIN